MNGKLDDITFTRNGTIIVHPSRYGKNKKMAEYLKLAAYERAAQRQKIIASVAKMVNARDLKFRV